MIKNKNKYKKLPNKKHEQTRKNMTKLKVDSKNSKKNDLKQIDEIFKGPYNLVPIFVENRDPFKGTLLIDDINNGIIPNFMIIQKSDLITWVSIIK